MTLSKMFYSGVVSYELWRLWWEDRKWLQWCCDFRRLWWLKSVILLGLAFCVWVLQVAGSQPHPNAWIAMAIVIIPCLVIAGPSWAAERIFLHDLKKLAALIREIDPQPLVAIPMKLLRQYAEELMIRRCRILGSPGSNSYWVWKKEIAPTHRTLLRFQLVDSHLLLYFNWVQDGNEHLRVVKSA